MSKITIDIPDRFAPLFTENQERFRQVILAALEHELERTSPAERLELVRTITRCKARVWNWEDLEREIFEGAV